MFSSDTAFNTAIFQALYACLEPSSSPPETSALIRPFPNDPEKSAASASVSECHLL